MSNRSIVIAYAWLSGLAFVSTAFPLLGSLLAIPTLGLALLAPTIWIYVTALIPAFLAWDVGRRMIGLALGAGVTIGLAFLPHFKGEQIAEQNATSLRKDDLNAALPQRPQAVEFVVSEGWRDRNGPDTQVAICDKVCQKLLLTGQVRTVTVRAGFREEPPLLVTYRVEPRSNCQKILEPYQILKSTAKAAAAGICLVASQGKVLTNGLSIRSELLERNTIPSFTLAEVAEAGRLTVSSVENGTETILFRQTRVYQRVASVPFAVAGYSSFLSTVRGMAILSNTRVDNPYGLLELLSSGLGYDIDPNPGPGRLHGSDPDHILMSQEG